MEGIDIIPVYYTFNYDTRNPLIRTMNFVGENIRKGDKPIYQVYNEVKRDPVFCRDGKTISYKHFLSVIQNDITLYTLSRDGNISGVLNFMLNVIDENVVFYINGVCSPERYSREYKYGKILMNTTIELAKLNKIKYIYLECLGERLMNYYQRFGFKITSQKTTYDSDEDSHDEVSEPTFKMRLEVSFVGGKKNIKKSIKRYKKKRRYTRRKK
jgi:predicted GNAT family N-acyltransferase